MSQMPLATSHTHIMVPLTPPPGTRFIQALHGIEFHCERSRLGESVEWLRLWVEDVLAPMARLEAERAAKWAELNAKQEEQINQQKLDALLAAIPESPVFDEARANVERVRQQMSGAKQALLGAPPPSPDAEPKSE